MQRTTFLPFAAVFLLVVSCGRPPSTRADNEILFTLTQTPTSTDARYEFLTLDRAGQLRERDGDCYFEPLEARLGTLIVEDGEATWKTPLVAENGVVVHANDRDGAHLDRAVWRTNDEITFDAHGFAMPEPKPLSFTAPPVDLEIISPVAGAIDLDVSDDRDLEILWRPLSRTDGEVVVSLDADVDERVICFFAAAEGHGRVPAGLLHFLRHREGTMKIGTHRQVSVPGPGDWFIYVVASHIARLQHFVMR